MTEASDIYEICLDRKSLCCIRQSGEDTCDKCKTYQMFKVGLETGRPEWHDLRKNPENLPTKEGYYCVIDNIGHYATTMINSLFIGHGDIADLFKAYDAIAWCKLPTFEK